MRTIKEINIWIFLNKYKNRLLKKTHYYDKYYNNYWDLNIQMIQDLSEYDLDRLMSSIETEKTYIN